MTDDEARAILQHEDFDAWIRWDNAAHKPDWWNRSITLDGALTREQLLAVLHFYPSEEK